MPGLPVNMKAYNPHTNGFQYLEDLATGYWYSELLFTALEMDIFEILDSAGISGLTPEELSLKTQSNLDAILRFLKLLVDLGLLGNCGNHYYNSQLSLKYLVKSSFLYQGSSILWRKKLKTDWETLKEGLQVGGRVNFPSDDLPEEILKKRRFDYLAAMDNVAQEKVQECLKFLPKFNGKILDVGAGSGAFTLAILEKFPDSSGVLLDIPEILPYTATYVQKAGFDHRIQCHPCNILENNWELTEKFDLIILSNIIHAYGDLEIKEILIKTASLLSDEGIILIHDFFTEHFSIKAGFSDLNMLINTYNGKVFSGKWVIELLKKTGLTLSPVVPLETDTALIFAGKTKKALEILAITPLDQIIPHLLNIGFAETFRISKDTIVYSEMAKHKCSYGCSSFNKKQCGANHIKLENTQKLVEGYSKILLLKGEPSTTDFQQKILKAENLAFKSGFYKAFSLWAGPCSICAICDPNTPCTNTKNRRPSMEGSGIDVFATVKNNGEIMKPLKEQGEYIKYYGLLLLD
ncbi:MAG: DUF2284 domain-containing protein [Eubacteriaceae bacterium]